MRTRNEALKCDCTLFGNKPGCQVHWLSAGALSERPFPSPQGVTHGRNEKPLPVCAKRNTNHYVLSEHCGFPRFESGITRRDTPEGIKYSGII